LNFFTFEEIYPLLIIENPLKKMDCNLELGLLQILLQFKHLNTATNPNAIELIRTTPKLSIRRSRGINRINGTIFVLLFH
jgi:hypothetical protein